MQNLHTYANRSMCTHLLTYAKFACMQKLKNLHLPQTKCKSHFAYLQILHICKSGHVDGKQFAHVSIYLIVLNKSSNDIVSSLQLFGKQFNLTQSCAALSLKALYQFLIKSGSCSSVILPKYLHV